MHFRARKIGLYLEIMIEKWGKTYQGLCLERELYESKTWTIGNSEKKTLLAFRLLPREKKNVHSFNFE